MSLLTTAASGQTAYTWVDENGQTHYSDRPFPGADVVELDSAQGFEAPQTPPRSAAAPEPANPADLYTALNVLQPAHQQTLWNIEGALDVTLEVAPALQAGHRLGLYLDGVLADVPAMNRQFHLTEVYRGQHTLQAVIVDAQGTEILRSLAVTFMVQQTSLLNPNNPNVR
ncbi:MAG: DUF4124 domain-containing protein [Gammaproteobacteria bacterium]